MCPELKVHSQKMHDSQEEKYLGDYMTTNAKHATTISKRRARGFGIISDITQILHHIEKSKKRIKVRLHLRKAWFINQALRFRGFRCSGSVTLIKKRESNKKMLIFLVFQDRDTQGFQELVLYLPKVHS